MYTCMDVPVYIYIYLYCVYTHTQIRRDANIEGYEIVTYVRVWMYLYTYVFNYFVRMHTHRYGEARN